MWKAISCQDCVAKGDFSCPMFFRVKVCVLHFGSDTDSSAEAVLPAFPVRPLPATSLQLTQRPLYQQSRSWPGSGHAARHPEPNVAQSPESRTVLAVWLCGCSYFLPRESCRILYYLSRRKATKDTDLDWNVCRTIAILISWSKLQALASPELFPLYPRRICPLLKIAFALRWASGKHLDSFVFFPSFHNYCKDPVILPIQWGREQSREDQTLYILA